MSWFYVGSALKLHILSRPVSPYDLFSIKALLLILSPWQLCLLLGPVSLCAVVFLSNFKLTKRPVFKVGAGLAAIIILILFLPKLVLLPLDFMYGNFSYYQKYNYERRGATIHLIQESVRYLVDFQQPPNHSQVHSAVHSLTENISNKIVNKNPFQNRNVYFIVMESFWDPLLLDIYEYSADPLGEEFRRLWETTEFSTALSPVYAGETPQTEFELLTGVPAGLLGEDFILFEYGIKNDIPSLPEIFNNSGYVTTAFHANVEEFWNREKAYSRLGIGQQYFEKDFTADDMNGRYVSDESFFKQTLDILSHTAQPFFAHILTISTHYPYPLDQLRRPITIEVQPHNPVLAKYVNSLYYSTKALVKFIITIQMKDPEALIMVTGDHLPYLGTNLEVGFHHKNSIKRKRFDHTAFEYLRHRVPLMVINGKYDNVVNRDVNMYEIPGIILDLLHLKKNDLMKLFKVVPEYRIRFLDAWNKNLILLQNGDKVLCTENHDDLPVCHEINPIYLNSRTVINDVLFGEQYSLSCLSQTCSKFPEN